MRAAGEREFLSCDWGTSHFRLKWCRGGRVVASVRNENGCKRLLQASREQGREQGWMFESQMESALRELVANSGAPERALPLLISGMASSTIGWKELPYARAPVALDGSQLVVEAISWPGPAWIEKTWLISGVTTGRDMIRGEEVEAIGLLSGATNQKEIVLVLPGTHSKHLRISEGVLREIHTYMTGELYAVLSEHSVLKASVEPGGFDESGFFAGIERTRSNGLAGSLFQARVRDVLEQKARGENAAFLSGLLIGTELEEGLKAGSDQILLGGAPRLRDLYGKALSYMGCKDWRAFSDTECESAVARGQERVLAQLGAATTS